MTGPVVCGIDFSDHSQRALAWARLFSEQLGRPLLIVHAVEPVLADAATLTYGPDALRASIEPELRAFVGPVAGGDVPVHIGVGAPPSVLSGAALAHNASLLVVGTQGLGRAARVWFGSTTLRLLRETTIPVLGVPPGAARTPSLSSLVVGTDFSDASTAALAPGTSVTSDVRTGDAADVLVDASATPGTVIVVGLGGDQTAQRPGTTAYRVLSTAESPVLGVPAPRT